MRISYDYHTHTTYSDGRFISQMISAAEDVGLDGIGFADHCNVSEQPSLEERKRRYGFNLDLTYERRRSAIEAAREQTDIRVFDAVEIDYHPDDEERTRTFLDRAGFDYVIGSVHEVNGLDLASWGPFREMNDEVRADIIDQYYDQLISLIESELFDIVAHLDFMERNPHLRGYATRDQYVRTAEALADSDTVPEINGARILSDYGEAHPAPTFLDELLERDVRFTAGTDGHRPGEVPERIEALSSLFDDRGIEPLTIHD